MVMVAMVAMVVVAPVAGAAFGDDFGIAGINDGAGPFQDVPAFPDTDDPLTVGNDADRAFFAGTCDLWSPSTVVGVAPANPRHCLDWRPNTQCDHSANCQVVGPKTVDPFLPGSPPAWRLAPVGDAGTHGDGTATFAFTRNASLDPDGAPDTLAVDLPPGFVGDPTAVAKCTNVQFGRRPVECPPESQVGVANIVLKGEILAEPLDGAGPMTSYPVYNLEPRRGRVAEFGIPSVAGFVNVRIEAKARTNGDFGVTTFVTQIPSTLPLYAQSFTIWGVPWAANHDLWRPNSFEIGSADEPIPPSGLPVDRRAPYDPSWGPIRPFLSNLTECAPAEPVTGLVMDSYEHQGARTAEGDPDPADTVNWKRYGSPSPVVGDCDLPPFDPGASFDPTSSAPGSASGLAAQITLPQNDDPPPPVAENPDNAAGAPAHWRSAAGLATSQLDRTVVTLPEGVSLNPASAAGLRACPDDVIGVREYGNPLLFNNVDPFDGEGVECPDGSKIGTVSVQTPLLDDPLTGEMVLGQPETTNPQGDGDKRMFRLFLVLRDKERGLVAKVFGSTVADPATGRLVTTFDKNPRVPFESLTVDVKGGQRGVLALPQQCGTFTTDAVFTPWTAAHGGGGPVRGVSDSFAVAGDCTQPFAPALAAGMDNRQGRGSGTFSFGFSRRDGEQWLRGLTARLPEGLLASVRGLPLCKDAQAAAGACPAASQIGIVDAKAGSGDPFVLERKGEVFLTEGYKGGEYGLAVKVRPIAGPFRGAMELSPITVRQAIHVDRKTAQVTAVSDPFPLIHHGVPLRVREVTVLIDRGGFMLNPSDCSAKQVGATLASDKGATAGLANRFQASGCAALPFKPRLGLRLIGRKQVRTGKHPAIRALVRQNGVGEAGIGKAEVRLPKTLALDVDNAQALCEFEDGTRPDLENHCPKGSIVGRARAQTPLLNDDLVGDVYFVKNVRIDPDSGNEIRTLPMIIAALRGEIAVNLVGESDVKGGKLVSTFADIPDAPISQFNMNIRGGRNGIVAVTRTRRSLINLCSAGRQVAEADMDGQNGKRHDFNVNMRKPCPRSTAVRVCRKRVGKSARNRRAFKACVAKVRKARAKRARGAAKRRAAAQSQAAARAGG